MRNLGQAESSHDGEHLLGPAERTPARHTPEYLGHGEPLPSEDEAGEQPARYEDEVNDGDGKCDERDAEAGAEHRGGSLQAIGPREHRNVYHSGGRGRAKTFQLYRKLSYFHSVRLLLV